MFIKQAHSGKGLAAKRHKLTVKCHYSQALGTQDTFQPKLMTKIEVISQKPSKNWIFVKNGNFLTLFGKKNPQF